MLMHLAHMPGGVRDAGMRSGSRVCDLTLPPLAILPTLVEGLGNALFLYNTGLSEMKPRRQPTAL